MPDPIRILIVDDHAVVRKGLAMVLRLEPGLEVLGEAQNGRAGLEMARRIQPDIVLVDLVMPEMDGPTAIAAIHQRQPEIAILALTSFSEPERIAGAIDEVSAAQAQKVIAEAVERTERERSPWPKR